MRRRNCALLSQRTDLRAILTDFEGALLHEYVDRRGPRVGWFFDNHRGLDGHQRDWCQRMEERVRRSRNHRAEVNGPPSFAQCLASRQGS